MYARGLCFSSESHAHLVWYWFHLFFFLLYLYHAGLSVFRHIQKTLNTLMNLISCCVICPRFVFFFYLNRWCFQIFRILVYWFKADWHCYYFILHLSITEIQILIILAIQCYVEFKNGDKNVISMPQYYCYYSFIYVTISHLWTMNRKMYYVHSISEVDMNLRATLPRQYSIMKPISYSNVNILSHFVF